MSASQSLNLQCCINTCENPLLKAFQTGHISQSPALSHEAQDNIVKALTEAYGSASKELERLNKLLEVLKASNELIPSAKKTIDEAKEHSLVLPFKRDEVYVADRVGIALLIGNCIDNVYIQAKGTTEFVKVKNPSPYNNVMAAITIPVMPGDAINWKREYESVHAQPVIGYFIALT
jgi:hypothetical protein